MYREIGRSTATVTAVATGPVSAGEVVAGSVLAAPRHPAMSVRADSTQMRRAERFIKPSL
jgi:hypothetical protein